MNSSIILNASRLKVFMAGLLLLSLFLKFDIFVYPAFFHSFTTNCLETQEFLINYAGGFVRRGLLGEIILQLINFTHYDFKTIVLSISLLCYILFTVWIMRSLKRNGVWIWLALMPLMCGELIFLVRKDYLQLVLMIPIIKLCADNQLNAWKVSAIALLCIIEILLHEAFIFWGAPIPLLCLVLNSKRRSNGVVAFLAIIAIFLISCVFKGDMALTKTIAASWRGKFPEMADFANNGIGGLNWTLHDTVHKHLNLNFNNDIIGHWLIIVRIAGYLIATFLITFAPALFNRDKVSAQELSKKLFVIWIILSVSMLPMFTILSCDYSRIYLYLSATTYGVVLTFPSSTLDSIAGRLRYYTDQVVNTLYTRMKPQLLSSLMLVLLLFFAITPWGFSISGAWEQSVVGDIVTLIERPSLLSINV